MFGLGFSEIIIILIVALIVIGPKDLPKVAARLANLLKNLQAASNELKTTFKETLQDEIPVSKNDDQCQ